MNIPASQAQNPIQSSHYRSLPEPMLAEAQPRQCSAPEMTQLNEGLLKDYGLEPDWFQSQAGLLALAGQASDKQAAPVALAYSGHQFGNWVPVLGDGRAHCLGQIETHLGVRDIQLKGSGRTPFSRGGDGLATLSSVLREYLISEAMAGLGISTTRSLAVITTGDQVMREGLVPGAILVRTAESHIRVGSFQYAYAQLGVEGVRALADHVMAHHYPELQQAESPYANLLSACVDRQASLVAQWMCVGFIHGVMNTDNVSVVGETIDFGPCAFMDEFNPQKVFSSIDRYGRYAWDKQPSIALWNLSRLADTLLPLLAEDEKAAIAIAEERLAGFESHYGQALTEGFAQKLGLKGSDRETRQFIQETLRLMAEQQVDFTIFFDTLTQSAAGGETLALYELFSGSEAIKQWVTGWQKLRSLTPDTLQKMRTANPRLIARNHRVEQALQAATQIGDFVPFRELATLLANPYELAEAYSDYQQPPTPEERVTETFCGT